MLPQPQNLDRILAPALDGLTHVGYSGKEIAEMAGVSAPTISKWRGGKSRTPAVTMVFLTLILAHKIEEFETYERRLDLPVGEGWYAGAGSVMELARQCLRAQESRNAALSPESIHEGARRYRHWLQRDAATQIEWPGAADAMAAGAAV